MKKFILFLCLLFTTQLASAQSLQKLTVILDWFPNPDHAPLIIAKQMGFFKEQGLDVELIGPADPSDPPKLVAASKADIGITYEPQFMQQVDRGLPLISIGTLIDKPLDCIVALQDSGINTIADLKGKRIGSGSSGISGMMLKVILEKADINPNDVEIINIKYNLTQALMSHKIDAVTGMMRNVEVPQLTLNNQKIITFFPEEHGIPNYSVLIFVTNLANKNDPRFPGFLAAIKKAVRYIDEHPKTAWEQFATAYPESNNAVNKAAWFTSLSYFTEEPGYIDGDEWQRFATFMLQNNMIKTVQPLSRYTVAKT
jgi:putative hydroxymethylpyrimidine transport system substrate-binding protein